MKKRTLISHLQLKRSIFNEVSIRANPEGDIEGKVEFVPKVTCGHHGENPRLWRVEVSLEIKSGKNKPFAYEGRVTAAGFFEVAAGFAEEEMAKFVAINGTSLVYGIIREMVLTVTSRSEKGELVLPTADFRNLSPEDGPSPRKKTVKKSTKSKGTA